MSVHPELYEDDEPKKGLKEISVEKNLNFKVNDDETVSPRFDVHIKANKSTKARKEDDYSPTEDELEEINKLTKVDLKQDQVLVFNLQSADEDIDRQFEHFTTRALKDMAEKSINKPILMDHYASTKSQVGKIFMAGVSRGKLMQKAYFPKSESNMPIVENILNGLYDKLSVGFSIDPNEMQCDSCGKSIYSMNCKHQPGSKDEAGCQTTITIKGVKDFYETSLVAIPAQPAAHIQGLVKEETEVETKAYTINDVRKALKLAPLEDPTGYLAIADNQPNVVFAVDYNPGDLERLQKEVGGFNLNGELPVDPTTTDKINTESSTTIEDSPNMEETKANTEVLEPGIEPQAETPVAEIPTQKEAEAPKAAEVPQEPVQTEFKSEKLDEILQKFTDLEQINKSQDEKIEKLTEAIGDLKKTIVALSEVSSPSLTKAILEPEEAEEDEPWYARFGQKVGGQ